VTRSRARSISSTSSRYALLAEGQAAGQQLKLGTVNWSNHWHGSLGSEPDCASLKARPNGS
jgi:hypothetical protein